MSTLLSTIDECIAFVAEPKTVRILCFGDSLTRGYTAGGFKHIPYSNTLERLIQTEYADNTKVYVTESGVDGELVTHKMKERLDANMTQTKYDIVIILGATNDIGSNVSTKEITATLGELYEIITNKDKAKCIAVTIPPYQKDDVYDDLEKKKNEINEYIKTNQSVHSVCDLYGYIRGLDKKQRSGFYDDFLHFTESGYEQFGELVFDTIRPLLFHFLT